MILSFFAFLVVSFSLLFGSVSFIVGFREQIPEYSLRSNKTIMQFDDWWTGIQSKGGNPEEIVKLNQKVLDDMKSEYESLSESGTSDDTKDIVNDIVYQSGGNLIDFQNQIKKPDVKSKLNHKEYSKTDKENINKIINKLSGGYDGSGKYTKPLFGNNNLVSYVLVNKYFNYFQNDYNIWKIHNNSERTINGVADQIYIYENTTKEDRDSVALWKYETTKYRNQENVLYLTYKSQKKYNFSLGQKVSIQNDNNMRQTFTYGGVVTTAFDYRLMDNRPEFYILNYKPENAKNDFRKSWLYSWDVFYFYKKNTKESKSEQIKELTKAAASDNGFINADGGKPFSAMLPFEIPYIFFAAMLALVVVIGVLLICLDVVVASFLIKETIRSLSKQLLFLKTIGVSNRESSLINTIGISMILGLSFVFSLIGMLGIQYSFLNLINQFIVDLNKWYVIQPMSLIFIFAVLAVLLIIYSIQSWMLTKNLSDSKTVVVNKSDYRFSKLRQWLFDRNVNKGITFSFSIKNLNKVLITFFITLLIVTLSFISLEFKVSINENYDLVNSIYLNKDEFSYYKTQVNYKAGDLPKDKEISYEEAKNFDIFNPPKNKEGWYIKSSTVEKILSDDKHNTLWDKAGPVITDYEVFVATMFNTSYDFTFNIGTVYTAQTDSIMANAFKLKINQTMDKTLIVLNKSDPRYNKLFDNEQFKKQENKKLPIVVSPRFLFELKQNDNEADPKGTISQLDAKNKNESDSDIDLQYISYVGAQNENLVYTTEDCFKQFSKLEIKPNSFYDNGLPITLRQIPINSSMIWSKIDMMSLFDIEFNRRMNDASVELINPLANTLLMILLLSLVLLISFVVFIIVSIMKQNDGIIFVLKSFGYSNESILRKMIFGYLVAIPLAVLLSIGITCAILPILDGVFEQAVFISIKFYLAWPVILFIIGLVAALTISIYGISKNYISKRNTTISDD